MWRDIAPPRACPPFPFFLTFSQFRFVAEALRTAKLRTYVPAFKQEAEDYFAKWGQTGVVDLLQVFSDLIILTASRTLLGESGRAAAAPGSAC